MPHLARILVLALSLVAAGTFASTASASWVARDAGPVAAAPPPRAPAAGAPRPFRDTVLARPLARASSHVPRRIERFTDAHGHRITLGTSLEGVDLSSISAQLAATVHGPEIETVRVRVVSRHTVARDCGGTSGVLACYGPDGRGRAGEMVVAHDEPALRHALVHEYGHHLDHQLLNLAHLGVCERSNDGSRRWFFAREAQSGIERRTGCDRRTPYARLLGELYAEDFVALNGIQEWGLQVVGPPAPAALEALRADLATPFAPSTRRLRGTASPGGTSVRALHVDTTTFLTASLTGPTGAGLDLSLRRAGTGRVMRRSARRGSRERVRAVLAPGDYELRVEARRAGPYRLGLHLE